MALRVDIFSFSLTVSKPTSARGTPVPEVPWGWSLSGARGKGARFSGVYRRVCERSVILVAFNRVFDRAESEGCV